MKQSGERLEELRDMCARCIGDFQPKESNGGKENQLLVPPVYRFQSDIGKRKVSNVRIGVA